MKSSTRFPIGLVVASVVAIAPPAGAADRSLEDDVFEAVFRQQLVELLDAEARAQGTVLCLEVDPGGAPQSASSELLARFKNETSVRRAAECEVAASRAREIATGRTAIVVTAGPLDPVAADEMWVTVVQRYRRGHSFKRVYRVVLERTRWISLGQIIKGHPL
jgi:hypothetical protein